MPISAAHYGLRRDDVKRAFPAWQNSLWSGFSSSCQLGIIARAPSNPHFGDGSCRRYVEREFLANVE